MNTQALHLDAAFAEGQPPFHQRLVNSMFTLSTLVGLSVTQLTQGTIVGNLGFSEIAFPKPLFHGDTMYAETVVTDKRESKSRPGEGIVTLAHTARNQHGDVVATAARKTMVRCRPAVGEEHRGELVPLDNAGPGWLFCPADRPERFEKAAAAADIVILDLEDGAGDKPAAREALVNTPLNPARTVIRINAADSGEQELDLEALARTDYTCVMLPKCESAEQVTALAPLEVVLIVETPLGALRVDETAAAANTVGVMWGAEDLFGFLGGTANRFPGRLLSRRRQVRAVTVAAGREGVRQTGAGCGVHRHQESRRPAGRGRRRRRGRVRHQGRDPSQPGRRDP